MMAEDTFLNALVSEGTDIIPQEYDWFAPLIGDWEFEYVDRYDLPEHRHLQGEWIFRRVLEGAGIEDLFICPSRATKKRDPQPDGEYGVAIRMFNFQKKCYDMVYTCAGKMCCLEFRKEDGKLIGTRMDQPEEKWVFAEITQEGFHWQNVWVKENGEWQVNSDVYAKRLS